MFKTHRDYKEVYSRGLQAAARASLAADWLVMVDIGKVMVRVFVLYRLGKDLEGLAPASSGGQAPGQMMLQTIKQHQAEVKKHFPVTVDVRSTVLYACCR